MQVGDIVEGKVTGITNFGVFVDLEGGKTGMVHISEIARVYVNDIREHVKLGDVVKMKVLNISDDGKISLSIKRAEERPFEPRQPRPQKPDNSFVWGAGKTEPATFEDMMSRFKQTSDEKFSDLKRKNPETRRKRGTGGR